MIIYPRVKNL